MGSNLPAEMNCYLVPSREAGPGGAKLVRRATGELPAGGLVVRVAWSSVNFKDALACTGHPGVVRNFPHVPGIDAAGTVVSCDDGRFQPGDEVIVTGRELGAPRWGAWADFIRVPCEWGLPRPASLSLREAMIYGTAGFTAAQCLLALERNGIVPSRGPVVVTGAGGGVGSIAVGLLAQSGFEVEAVSGRESTHDLLRKLGATKILGRDAVDDTSDKPLLAARWAGAVDGVGGRMLATIVRSMQHRGCVTCYGLVGGVDIPLTVYPFILRGVTMQGIDSAQCPDDMRQEVWRRLAGQWKLPQLELLAHEIRPEQISETVHAMLQGGTTGRVVIKWV